MFVAGRWRRGPWAQAGAEDRDTTCRERAHDVRRHGRKRAVGGATSYNLKRSTTNGGPYTNVFVGLTATSVVDIGLNNGTTYFYVVTAVNAERREPAVQPGQRHAAGAHQRRRGTITASMGGSSPWYFENRLSIANTASISNVVVTVRVARATGVTFNGSYEILGAVSKKNTNTASGTPITFTFTGTAALGTGSGRLFVAQTNGSGTAHPSTGDTWTVTYTVAGQQFTQSGACQAHPSVTLGSGLAAPLSSLPIPSSFGRLPS